ncbi:zinc ribbon domain-containing protein [Pistricoccus aurantiacus]|uniref:Zinc ribbon domain-containing protein n=1 Tax=Pistricoccus aurantiacus TaxID=1883414 RepID=A0A5B8SYP7_9GAMM|nr:zinc ribbon domain-containing protein [Pistricoccus aurantiacus]QEA39940.1 zinc ribbon domain-containing protein [Pistricoccus aurantiacus]
MPIYEYECKACGHRLEKLQKISAAPLTDCPSCEASSLSRLVSAAGFRLAGGGWYETDFKSGDNKRNLADDRKPAAKDDAGSKQGSDSKQGASSRQDGSAASVAKPTVKKDTAV